MNRPAHTIKPGDKINGVDVFDTIRPCFGGYYIPLEDGSRYSVKSLETIVRISA